MPHPRGEDANVMANSAADTNRPTGKPRESGTGVGLARHSRHTYSKCNILGYIFGIQSRFTHKTFLLGLRHKEETI